MSMPKSVVKMKYKDGKTQLEFIDSVDKVNYTIQELIQRANADVGRFLVRDIRRKVKGINRYTKAGKYIAMRYQYWARKKEGDLQIGVENTKYGAETAWWADQSELGTNGQPKRAFIYNTTKESIDTIRQIQAQYLSAINDELEAERLVAEAEQMADEPDEMNEE